MNIEYPCLRLVRQIMLPLALSLFAVSAMGQSVWTLESSIKRVHEVAPEVQEAEAKVTGQQGALQQAGAWPNPEFEIRGDNEIDKDEGSGGGSLTQFRFSQPLPVSGRLKHQKAVARANLSGAQFESKHERLLLELQTANRFHALQFSIAVLDLAEQRLQLADELQKVGRRREEAGELSKLERLRLDIIRESAKQLIDQSEGEYSEAFGEFRAYLGLALDSDLKLVPLEAYGLVSPLDTFLSKLPEHPAILVERDRMGAARAEVKTVKSRRFPDPELNLFQERAYLNDDRENVTGIGITFSLPIWDRKRGNLIEARSQINRAQYRRVALERDLESKLRESHLHLGHMVEQSEHFRAKIFEPARTIFDLTRKAYTAGEIEILSLIDANDTYYNAYERYLELLQEAWLESAELRYAAGIRLVPTAQDNQL